MKVVIEADVFADPAVNSVHIYELLTLAYHERCRVVTEPEYSSEDADDDHPVHTWLVQQSDSIRECFQLTLDESLTSEALRPSAASIRIVGGNGSDWKLVEPRLGLVPALAFLQKPFRVLLENNRNDRAFLLAVAEPEDRAYLQRLEEEGWLEFEHAGGLGEMKHRVEAARTSPGEARRIWVLVDSDARQPKMASDASNRILVACGGEIPVHQLSRRSIENYLPIEALSVWARGKGGVVHKVSALNALSRDQRNHYPMKKGFSGDQKGAAGTHAGTLYDGLGRHLREKLDEGFGDKIGHIFEDPDLCQRSWFHGDGQLVETTPMIRKLLSIV